MVFLPFFLWIDSSWAMLSQQGHLIPWRTWIPLIFEREPERKPPDRYLSRKVLVIGKRFENRSATSPILPASLAQIMWIHLRKCCLNCFGLFPTAKSHDDSFPKKKVLKSIHGYVWCNEVRICIFFSIFTFTQRRKYPKHQSNWYTNAMMFLY